MLTKIWELNVLSAVIIGFYAVGLPLAIWVCRKHGIGRHAGWLYLALIAVIRIVGSSLRIAADSKSTVGLVIAATAFQSIGLAAFIQAFMGLLKRVNDGLEAGRISPRIFQLTHLITLVGLFVGIASSAHASSRVTDDQHKASAERKASGIMLFISVAINCILALYLFSRSKFPTDRIISLCCAIAVPFFIVRIAYLLLVTFSSITTYTYVQAQNIWEMAFMQFFMEMVIFGLFVLAGLRSVPIGAEDHEAGRGHEFLPGKMQGPYRGQAKNVEEKTIEADPVVERV